MHDCCPMPCGPVDDQCQFMAACPHRAAGVAAERGW
jgi:hypothetical protein